MKINHNDENKKQYLDDEDEIFQQSSEKALNQNIEKIDLLQSQKQLLRQILNLSSIENQREQRKHAQNMNQQKEGVISLDEDEIFNVDDDDNKICIGFEGTLLEKQLFKFKILVYDNQVQNMIAPIFKVGNLRECNVVLHLNINQKKDICPGLPAIYLVEPNQENFKAIASDCQKNLYDFVFINFSRQISEQDLDKFAIEMVKANAINKICRVSYDHLGAYQVITQDFFSFFNQKDNFSCLYQSKNEDIIINTVAQNLYETFCSLGIAPYLRVEESDDPQVKKVIQKLQDLFKTTSEEQLKEFNQKNRPLLVIFNRKRDIQGMLYHSWKYLSLIQDIFGIKNNQFLYQQENSQKEVFELDFSPNADEILNKNKFVGFHEAGPNVDAELSKWSKEYEKFGGQQNQTSQISDISQNLTSAIDKLPQMTEQKKKIDMHVKIASKILTDIKERHLDKYQDIEEEIISSRKISGENKQDMLNILGLEVPFQYKNPNQQFGAFENQAFVDKIRLLVIIILCMQDIEEILKYIQVVENTHKQPQEVEVIQKIKLMVNKKQQNNQSQQSENKSEQKNSTLGFALSLTKGIASGVFNMLTENNNAQNIFAKDIKQTLSQQRSKYQQASTYFVDLLTGEQIPLLNFYEIKTVFAFSLGGGSYHEYESMKIVIEQIEETASSAKNFITGGSQINVVYGCDYIFQPQEFLQEILKLLS